MIYWIIGIVLYLVIAFFSYEKVFKSYLEKDELMTKFDAIWYSAFWPATLLLYFISKCK